MNDFAPCVLSLRHFPKVILAFSAEEKYPTNSNMSFKKYRQRSNSLATEH
jgi:hypothetical protein